MLGGDNWDLHLMCEGCSKAKRFCDCIEKDKKSKRNNIIFGIFIFSLIITVFILLYNN